MAHIQLPEGIPGILGPMAFSPETAKPLNALAEVLLRGPNTLTPAEREMIATYVSSQNDCYFCQNAHGAVAAYRLGGDEKLVNDVKVNFESAEVSGKMKSLLAIAGKVQKGGKQVTAEDVERARKQGATDKEIHDAVLIAAAFCMYNRYVDGLATWAPSDPEMYRQNGRRLAEEGYVVSTTHLPAVGKEKEYV
ncbi:MAG TPA: peroxidase-related enzyme [Candidatus Sulfotelmatobacter sp.]